MTYKKIKLIPELKARAKCRLADFKLDGKGAAPTRMSTVCETLYTTTFDKNEISSD